MGKAARANAAKQQRDAKREQLLADRRSVGAPRVIAFLPLSEVGAAWIRSRLHFMVLLLDEHVLVLATRRGSYLA
jgi:hypothetical protein